MIGLFADAIVAVLRVVARLHRASPTDSPPVVADAQPAGAAASAATGPGGHPIRPTSELLHDAAIWVAVDFPEAEQFVHELRDRAAQLAAHGD